MLIYAIAMLPVRNVLVAGSEILMFMVFMASGIHGTSFMPVSLYIFASSSPLVIVYSIRERIIALWDWERKT